MTTESRARSRPAAWARVGCNSTARTCCQLKHPHRNFLQHRLATTQQKGYGSHIGRALAARITLPHQLTPAKRVPTSTHISQNDQRNRFEVRYVVITPRSIPGLQWGSPPLPPEKVLRLVRQSEVCWHDTFFKKRTETAKITTSRGKCQTQKDSIVLHCLHGIFGFSIQF